MKSYSYLFAVLLVPLSAHADSIDANDCTRIENETQRLKCYDDLFQRTAAGKLENTKAEPPPQESPDAHPGPEGASAAVSAFGAENIEAPPIDFVEARLVGDFNGWTGTTVFTLDNGQVWRQTKNYIQDYTPRDPIPAAKVTISKGMMGSYNLQVEGVKRIVQVKRVK
jgi:hypothetical protein